MKHIFILLVLFKSIFSSLEAIEINSDFSFGLGYRQDDLSWEISSLPLSNVLTTEKWQNIQIFQLSGEVEAYVCDRLYLQCEADYGWLERGKKSFDELDLDGAMTVTEEEWLTARPQGYVYDFSGSVGYLFPMLYNCLRVMPLVGWSYNVQHFKDSHYKDKIHLLNVFEGVKSSYTYRWNGPWAGFNVAYMWKNQLNLFFQYQFHWSSYRATIKDNLVDEESEHQKKYPVSGNALTLGLLYPWNCWAIRLVGNYKLFKGHHGSNQREDQTFRLKQIRWRSLGLNLEITRYF
jgi:hypothetical protein